MHHPQPYSPSTAFMPAHYTGSRESHGMKWHYTTGECFYLIIHEGIIRPATAFIPKGQRPITWFSSNPIWEPTACKGILVPEGPMRAATFEEQVDYGMGLVRIGVARQTAPHPFPVLVKKSRMPRSLADGLV